MRKINYYKFEKIMATIIFSGLPVIFIGFSFENYIVMGVGIGLFLIPMFSFFFIDNIPFYTEVNH